MRKCQAARSSQASRGWPEGGPAKRRAATRSEKLFVSTRWETIRPLTLKCLASLSLLLNMVHSHPSTLKMPTLPRRPKDFANFLQPFHHGYRRTSYPAVPARASKFVGYRRRTFRHREAAQPEMAERHDVGVGLAGEFAKIVEG